MVWASSYCWSSRKSDWSCRVSVATVFDAGHTFRVQSVPPPQSKPVFLGIVPYLWDAGHSKSADPVVVVVAKSDRLAAPPRAVQYSTATA